MADPRFAVIVNPKAAGGKAIKKLPEISAAASSVAPEYLLHVTSSIEDASLRAREFANLGIERIVAVGGDGTFNEVANGMLESEARPALGIVPAGTGCDLPRTLGVPTDITEALVFALTGEARPMDVGLAKTSTVERHFLNVAGMGFDAKVADRAQQKKRLSGKKAYIAALAQSLTDFGYIDVRIEVNGQEITTEAVFVSIANAHTSPAASTSPRWLASTTVCSIWPSSTTSACPASSKLFRVLFAASTYRTHIGVTTQPHMSR